MERSDSPFVSGIFVLYDERDTIASMQRSLCERRGEVWEERWVGHGRRSESCTYCS